MGTGRVFFGGIFTAAIFAVSSLALTGTARADTQAQADSCSEADANNEAAHHCHMKEIAIAGAIAQGVDIAAFTTAGALGIKACVNEGTSKGADRAAMQAIDALKSSADGSLTTAYQAVNTANNTSRSSLQAMQASVTDVRAMLTAAASALTAAQTAEKAAFTAAMAGPCDTAGRATAATLEAAMDSTTAAGTATQTSGQTLAANAQALNAPAQAVNAAIEGVNASIQAYKGLIATAKQTCDTAAEHTPAPSAAAESAAVSSAQTLQNAGGESLDGTGQTLNTSLQTYTQNCNTVVTSLSALTTQVATLVTQTAALQAAAAAHVAGAAADSTAGCAGPQASACCAGANAEVAAAAPVQAATAALVTAVANLQRAVATLTGLSTTNNANAIATQTASQTYTNSAVSAIKTQATSYTGLAQTALTLRATREASREVYRKGRYVAWGLDLAGGAAVVAATAAMGERVDIVSLITSVGGTALSAGVQLLTNTRADRQEDVGCPLSPIMDLAQAGMRVYNMKTSIDTANQESNYGRMVRGNQAVFNGGRGPAQTAHLGTVNGQGATAQSNTAGGSDETRITRDLPPADRARVSPQAISSSFATAQTRQELPKMLQDATGSNPEQLTRRIMDGQSPMAATAAVLNLSSGPEYDALMNSDKNQEKLYALMGPELQKIASAAPKTMPAANSNFESNLKAKQVAKTPSKAMPDFSSFFKPQAAAPKEAAGSPAPAYVTMGVLLERQAGADGFHTQEASIFEVVASRYQRVSQKFLNGDSVVSSSDRAAPSNDVPKNIYLKKN